MVQGIVYVLSNPAMPGLVKIGMTEREDTGARLAELYGTGVPFPFHCEFAYLVDDPRDVEAKLHNKFVKMRVNPHREFFAIDARKARQALLRMDGYEVTDEVARALEQKSVSESSRDETGATESNRNTTFEPDLTAESPRRKRRPNLNFVEMGIPIGAQIISVTSGESAKVISEKKIRFRDKDTSLWAASKLTTGRNHPGPPTAEWTYDGVNVGDLYIDTYGLYD